MSKSANNNVFMDTDGHSPTSTPAKKIWLHSSQSLVGEGVSYVAHVINFKDFLSRFVECRRRKMSKFIYFGSFFIFGLNFFSSLVLVFGFDGNSGRAKI